MCSSPVAHKLHSKSHGIAGADAADDFLPKLRQYDYRWRPWSFYTRLAAGRFVDGSGAAAVSMCGVGRQFDGEKI